MAIFNAEWRLLKEANENAKINKYNNVKNHYWNSEIDTIEKKNESVSLKPIYKLCQSWRVNTINLKRISKIM